MKKLFITRLSAMVMCMGFLCTGCGASYDTTESITADMNAGYAAESIVQSSIAEESYDSGEYDSKDYVSGSGLPEQGNAAQNDYDKWVRTIEAEYSATDFSEAGKQIPDMAQKYGGYIDNSSVTDYSCYFHCYIPTENADAFLEGVNSIESILKLRNLNDQKVNKGKEYSDNKTLIDNLMIEQETLQKLLEQAESVSDIIEIQDRLTQIHYRIQSATKANNNIDFDVEFTEINIRIRTERSYDAPTFPELLKEKWTDAKEGFAELMATLLTSLILIPSALLGALLVSFIIGMFIKFTRLFANMSFKKKPGKTDENPATADKDTAF